MASNFQAASAPRRTNMVEKLELLLFRCGGQFFATRAQNVSSLMRGAGTALRSDSSSQEALPPELAAAFLGVADLNGIPVFRLDQLLETTDSSDFVGNQIILTSYNKYMVGLAVQEVFEVRTFEISKVELLPPLIEQVRRRDIAWALLRLDEPLVLDVSNNQETVIQAGELLVIVDLSRLFYSATDQGFEDWLIQVEATYSQVII